MPRTPSVSAVSDAVSILSAGHREVTRNEYGRTIVAGFSVTEGLEGSARVSHATPEPDLLDPERPSDDEVAQARHRMVSAYARALTEAGWTVVQRTGPHSRNPYLLASR